MFQLLLNAWRHRPTHRRVWALATPMILSNISVPLVSLVDITVAGHLPHTRQLAAVAVGGSIFTVVAGVCGFLRMGITGVAAQAHGQRNGEMLRRVLFQALLLGIATATVALIILWPLLPSIMQVMQTADELQTSVLTYLHMRLPALPAVLVNYALTGWFLGLQNARVAFGILLTTNIGNILLDLLFVPVLHWGVSGIALASVLGAAGGMVFALSCVRRELNRHPGATDWTTLRRWLSWRSIVAVNRDIFLRSVALQGVFLAMTVLGTRLGANVVAANALLLNGLLLTSFALDGLANAVEAMSGAAIGAGNKLQLQRALVVCGGWSLLASLVCALFFGFGGHLFVDLQTTMENVRQTAYAALPWLVILPVVAVGSYFLDGLYVGAARAHQMRDCMFLAAIGFGLLVWLLRPWGNDGLWLAFIGFMALRAATMGWTARRVQRNDGWLHAHASHC